MVTGVIILVSSQHCIKIKLKQRNSYIFIRRKEFISTINTNYKTFKIPRRKNENDMFIKTTNMALALRFVISGGFKCLFADKITLIYTI